MKPTLFHALSSLVCLSAVPQVHAQVDTAFIVELSVFVDSGVMDRKYADKNLANTNYAGDSVSSSLHWSNVSTGINSLVLVVSDPQGAGSLGMNHWMTHGVPTMRASLPEDAGTGSVLRMGQSSVGRPAYPGPCPPKGTGMHHHVFLLVATDLAPDALPNGLARVELDMTTKGHSKGAVAWIDRFGSS